MAKHHKMDHNASLETILTIENRQSDSEWSVVWSTEHVPTMDRGIVSAAHRAERVIKGRRRLRYGALAIGGLLTMHCRVTATMLTGGFFAAVLMVTAAVAVLANPLRHFEVYLGQWSISGPGRAFKIIPAFDGIGIAICANVIVRAILCTIIAAITLIYVWHAVSDSPLPFTYCRTFELESYEPIVKIVPSRRFKSMPTEKILHQKDPKPVTTVGMEPFAWRNISKNSSVEVMRLRPDYSMKGFNFPLLLAIVLVYLILWAFMIYEKMIYKRIIFNNTYPLFFFLPWIWTVGILLVSINLYAMKTKPFQTLLRLSSSAKPITGSISDALQVSLYLHSASTGSSILLGKGLNHYASGHIDPQLNNENVWHSVTLLLLTVLSSGGASLCALIDHYEHKHEMFRDIYESTLWTLPMYSTCTAAGSHSHFMTAVLFLLLTLSYMVIAYDHLKTALHTIFEYRVKLVFFEQIVVGSTIVGCMWCSLIFATNAGIPTLESLEAMITGVVAPFICLLELVGLLYAYSGRDFVSDMNVATEENTCATRMEVQWNVIPVVTLVTLILKILAMIMMEMPSAYAYICIVPVMVIVLSVPLRAVHNAFVFLRPAPRHGI